MTEQRLQWMPSSDVCDHTGSALAADAIFFAPPPPEIGTVLTAHSGVYRTGSAMSKPMAQKVIGLFTLLGVVLGGFLGLGVAGGAVWGAAVGALLGGGIIGGAMFRRESRKRDCTYVGTHGIARCKYPGKSAPDILRFADAVEVQTAFLGRTGGTNFNFQWRNAQGKVIYKLEGGYYGNKRGSDPESVCHFAVAAEKAWSDFLLPQVMSELQRQGSSRFLVNRALSATQYATLSPGSVELPTAKRPVRLLSHEIADILVFQGLIMIRRHGAKDRGFPSNDGSDGIFRLSYGSVANVKIFLRLLEQVVGVSCRYED